MYEKNIKRVEIFRHHPVPRNLPGLRQSPWREDAVTQVSLLGDLASEVMVVSHVSDVLQFKH